MFNKKKQKTQEEQDAEMDENFNHYFGFIWEISHPFVMFKVNRKRISAKDYREYGAISKKFLEFDFNRYMKFVGITVRTSGADYQNLMDMNYEHPLVIRIERGDPFDGYFLSGYRQLGLFDDDKCSK